MAEKSYAASRVLTASPLRLVVIVYESLIQALRDCREAIGKKDDDTFRRESDRALAILSELFDSLDFSVDLSRDLGAIYVYLRKLLLKAVVTRSTADFELAEKILKPLYDGFAEIADKADDSQPVQEGLTSRTSFKAGITAGITYGRGSLNEAVIEPHRGIKA